MRDPLPTFPISDLSAASAPRRSLHRREPTARAPEFDKNHFGVVWARDEEDVRQARRLRHLVFVGEMGARLTLPKGADPARH